MPPTMPVAHGPTAMFTLHRATAQDIDTIAPLFDAYRQFYAQPADPQRAADWLRARIAAGESTVLHTRDATGAVLGFAQLYRSFSSVRTARTWVLNDLYVVDAARRQGVARALLDAAVAFAKRDGAAVVSLETSRDNAPARALYRAAGWSEDASQWYSVALDA